jgi:hypothetical protein
MSANRKGCINSNKIVAPLFPESCSICAVHNRQQSCSGPTETFTFNRNDLGSYGCLLLPVLVGPVHDQPARFHCVLYPTFFACGRNVRGSDDTQVTCLAPGVDFLLEGNSRATCKH